MGYSEEVPVIRVQALAKEFSSVKAVDGIDFAVSHGEVFGFLGPNGAGKTTTISMLLGLLRPTAGEIEIFGEKVTPERTAPLRRVGSLVSTPGLLPYASGRANLRLLKRLTPGLTNQDVETALERVDMLDRADRSVRTYSTGMKQRIGLAAALLHHPDLLILDEPTNGLDPVGMREIRNLIKHLASEGVTVFLSSHLLVEVEAVCDRVAVLNHGHIVAQGAVSDLLGQNEIVRVRTGVPEDVACVLRSLSGVVQIIPNGAYVDVSGPASEDIIRHLVQHNLTPREVFVKRPDLENIFMELTEAV